MDNLSANVYLYAYAWQSNEIHLETIREVHRPSVRRPHGECVHPPFNQLRDVPCREVDRVDFRIVLLGRFEIVVRAVSQASTVGRLTRMDGLDLLWRERLYC